MSIFGKAWKGLTDRADGVAKLAGDAANTVAKTVANTAETAFNAATGAVGSVVTRDNLADALAATGNWGGKGISVFGHLALRSPVGKVAYLIFPDAPEMVGNSFKGVFGKLSAFARGDDPKFFGVYEVKTGAIFKKTTDVRAIIYDPRNEQRDGSNMVYMDEASLETGVAEAPDDARKNLYEAALESVRDLKREKGLTPGSSPALKLPPPGL